jgi:hypothetical protein
LSISRRGSSSELKEIPFRQFFTYQKSRMSGGSIFGEYGGCGAILRELNS